MWTCRQVPTCRRDILSPAALKTCFSQMLESTYTCTRVRTRTIHIDMYVRFCYNIRFVKDRNIDINSFFTKETNIGWTNEQSTAFCYQLYTWGSFKNIIIQTGVRWYSPHIVLVLNLSLNLPKLLFTQLLGFPVREVLPRDNPYLQALASGKRHSC